MKRTMLAAAAVAMIAVGTGVGLAQKQPQPKSQKEAEAINAIFTAADADARIAAADALLKNFADTEFKAVALQVAAASAQEKNDFEKMVFYAEQTLQADPKNYASMLMLATGYAQRTREHDLDKEDKLKMAEKYANSAIETVKTATKPRPDITDEQWENAKKDFTAQGMEALGIAAMTRKNYDEAIKQFKAAIDAGGTPEPVTKLRLASAYNQTQKYDEALTLLDGILAQPDLHPQVRSLAGQEKLKAATGKSQKK
ncbi:MAG: tetratricopeptide repeat protein [Bryobacteraceae bacterium]